jgi:hypothetical protein
MLYDAIEYGPKNKEMAKFRNECGDVMQEADDLAAEASRTGQTRALEGGHASAGFDEFARQQLQQIVTVVLVHEPVQ